MELNPNHPTSRAVSDHWHKIAALLMLKFGVDHTVITEADIVKMDRGMGITVQELRDGLHLRIVDETTAQLLARQEGGLPT